MLESKQKSTYNEVHFACNSEIREAH